MRCFSPIFATVLAMLSPAMPAAGQDVKVREYDENGLRYRETIRTVQRPVIEMQAKDQQRLVTTPNIVTEVRKQEQTVLTPITEYAWQPIMRNRWNPFGEPYYEYRLVPTTRWETKTRTVDVPVQYQQTTSKTVTDRVLVPTTRMATEEFISREIIGAARGTGTSAANLAKREEVGGISLKDDKQPATAANGSKYQK